MKTQYEIALQAASLQDLQNRQTAWQAETPDEFDLPVWYFQKTEDIAAVETLVEAMEASQEDELANLTRELEDASNADLVAAEERMDEYRALAGLVPIVAFHLRNP